MSTISKYILGILVIIAVVLGYKIYEKKAPASAKPVVTSNQSTSTPVTTNNTTVKTAAAIPKPPAAGASNTELRAWGELISKLAVPTNKLEITACKPNPAVIALDSGTSFSVTNKDSVSHILVLNPTTTFTIDAGATKSIKADFGKGPGMYAYGCDNGNEPVGVFLVK
jgi:hypothetical protein